MYDPSAFLISTTALTSIFSFFFGGYFRERERAYRLWLKYVAYDKKIMVAEAKIDLCAELESLDRMFLQVKGLLAILLLTIILAYIVFQFYSFRYILPGSSLYDPGAFSDYISFNTIIGCIVLINCLELLYIRIAVDRVASFPFFRFRRRINAQERLSKIWMLVGCSKMKVPEYAKNRIPRHFYDNEDFYSTDR
jgi:hypothetical protein